MDYNHERWLFDFFVSTDRKRIAKKSCRVSLELAARLLQLPRSLEWLYPQKKDVKINSQGESRGICSRAREEGSVGARASGPVADREHARATRQQSTPGCPAVVLHCYKPLDLWVLLQNELTLDSYSYIAVRKEADKHNLFFYPTFVVWTLSESFIIVFFLSSTAFGMPSKDFLMFDAWKPPSRYEIRNINGEIHLIVIFGAYGTRAKICESQINTVCVNREGANP